MVKPHGLLDKWKEHQAAERQKLDCAGLEGYWIFRNMGAAHGLSGED